MAAGGVGTGVGVVLGGQLKPGWLYDISGVPRLGDNAIVIRSASGSQVPVQKKELPSKPESGLEPLFIVALQRIATCGINYAAIMSCFVAQIFGFAFFYESVGINYIIFGPSVPCSLELIRWKLELELEE